ncbi:unnamed protein product [Wickerhamomyces anomalus]
MSEAVEKKVEETVQPQVENAQTEAKDLGDKVQESAENLKEQATEAAEDAQKKVTDSAEDGKEEASKKVDEVKKSATTDKEGEAATEKKSFFKKFTAKLKSIVSSIN